MERFKDSGNTARETSAGAHAGQHAVTPRDLILDAKEGKIERALQVLKENSSPQMAGYAMLSLAITTNWDELRKAVREAEAVGREVDWGVRCSHGKTMLTLTARHAPHYPGLELLQTLLKKYKGRLVEEVIGEAMVESYSPKKIAVVAGRKPVSLVNAPANDGYTALMAVCENQFQGPEAIRLFREHGADLTARTYNLKRPELSRMNTAFTYAETSEMKVKELLDWLLCLPLEKFAEIKPGVRDKGGEHQDIFSYAVQADSFFGLSGDDGYVSKLASKGRECAAAGIRLPDPLP